jgi:magnesium-transporting ATPase (P-type)
MDLAKGLFYLALAVFIVIWAIQNKTWSWKLFGWVMLMTIVLGGAAIWAGVAFGQMFAPSNPGLATTAMLGFVIVAVLIVTLVTIKLSRRYRPPGAIK